MTPSPTSRSGGWAGAASWQRDAEAPGPALLASSTEDAGSPPVEAPEPAGQVPEPADQSQTAVAADRLARAREALRRAEAGEPETPAPGVPDFLPPGAAAAPATWSDVQVDEQAEAQPDESSRSAPARGRRRSSGRARRAHADRSHPDRSPGERPRRRGRAEDPPSRGAAAVDAEPDPQDVARQIVLRQLAMGPRSRAQLATKLRQRACPEDVIERVLDRMTEVGLVDDAAYAEMLVRSRQQTKGLARRALAQELRTKGIDKDLADEVLAEVDPDEERGTARRLVDKKLRTMSGLAVEVQTRRLAGMLARKGYPPGVAYAVIRDAIADAPEHQRD